MTRPTRDESDEDDRMTGPHHDISDEKIAGLLRLTGPRPGVPADRTNRVMAVVRARWRAELGGRSRRRIFRAAAGLAAAVALVLWFAWTAPWRLGVPPTSEPPAPGTLARVEAVSGAIEIRPPAGNGGATVRAGLEVPPGGEIETGEDGRLAIRLPSGASLRLDVDTRVEMLSYRSMVLTAGAVYVDSRRPGDRDGPAGESIEVRTPAGSVREIGTQFEVRMAGAAVRVRVREGRVNLDHPVGFVEVRSGRELQVDGDGRTSTRELSIHGEEWAWTEAIAPRMAIEGRFLREFLDWMARERGLGLRFGRDDLAASASTIRLNGSIEGLTLDQALESVLLTCGMRHRIEGGVLWVEAPDGPAL